MKTQFNVGAALLTLALAGVATPAAAQDGPGSNIAAGAILREDFLNTPKGFAASVAFAVSRHFSIEIAGQGLYRSGPSDDFIGETYHSRSQEAVAGVRVTPVSTDFLRVFGHVLAGPRFNRLIFKDFDGTEIPFSKSTSITINPGVGIDFGSRKIAGRFQYDRPFAKSISSTPDSDEKGFYSFNRVTLSVVIGF